ncbi:MAG: segregation/condensation protein A [Deltaproteobacteria bacterium]|nr:segregation/condensation protein A [Deltaproteobacteria bacterium]
MNLFADAYKVSLPVFEGPLDLLIHLIKKNDVEVADIPIATILEQYIDYLGLMQELNIDLAGEFILMAAELTHIKSKMLLPDAKAEEEEEEDPRADLARRLLEYQRFKEAAAELAKRPMLGRDVFVRPPYEPEEVEEPELEADVFKLLSAFGNLLKNLKPEHYHQVAVERLSVTERIYELLEVLKERGDATFESLFEENASKGRCIVTFLAILEMTRLKLIRVFQASQDMPLRIQIKEEQPNVENLQVGSEFDESESSPQQENLQ